jgi:signal transduction histidine kinase
MPIRLVSTVGTVIDMRSPHTLWRFARFLPLLLTPALLLASTFPGEYRVPGIYWVLALTACALFVVADRWPLPVSVAISALALPMFIIPAWGPSDLVPFLGAIALVEVIVRRDRVATVVATGCWAIAVVAGHWGGHAQTFWQPATLVEASAYVGLPLLLGLYLRGQRELTASLRLRAADAETRTRAEERAALARELHDLVAHHIASIVLRVKVARRAKISADPRVLAVFDDVHDTAAGALADIRRLLVVLRDPALGEVALVEPAAVAKEIRAAVARVRSAGFTVEADVDPELDGLDAIGRLTLLRLVQESLTNVMKHADHGQPVSVTVRKTDSVVRLQVSSGGQAQSGTAGHGVIGMRERAHLAGGTLTAGPAHPGSGGWLVDAELPTATTLSASPP